MEAVGDDQLHHDHCVVVGAVWTGRPSGGLQWVRQYHNGHDLELRKALGVQVQNQGCHSLQLPLLMLVQIHWL
jgi:hypothetical protein